MIASIAAALVFFSGEGMDPAAAQATLAEVKERLTRDGAGPLDLSAEHRALLAPKLFVDFAAPLPDGLPPELAGPWKSGNDACAKQTGPTGPELAPQARAAAAATARACRDALGLALWDALLEQRKVARVVEVELRVARGSGGSKRTGAHTGSAAPGSAAPATSAASTGSGQSGGIHLTLSLHEPGTSRRTLRLENASASRLATAAADAVGDLLGGAGTSSPARRHPLPSIGLPGIEAIAPVTPAPAVAPAACSGLPARLEVFPLGTFTRAVEIAYLAVPASKRTGKPLRCDVVLYPGYEAGPAKNAFARMACPPAQLRAASPLGEDPKAAAAKLASQLANEAAAALCAP